MKVAMEDINQEKSVRGTRMLKNTIFLYIRMFVILCINLVAVRLLLSALGETDYGIFNVVGGIVTLLSFIASSMSSAAQRFYAYYIGREEYEELKKVFKVSIFTFIIIIIASVLIAETAGLWLLYNKMTIPADRLNAATWVFHLSVVSFSINMMLVPFLAMVQSTERMDFFAIVSMAESLFKLAIIFLVANSNADHLIFYASLFTVVVVMNFLAYVFFVRNKNRYLSFIPKWDKKYFSQLFSYCSWYMYGAISTVIRSQGINILLNIFFNPVVNAARGIAYQVDSAVNAFVNSFFSAVRPQVVKRYAANEMDSLRLLISRSTSLSYYLILIMSVPLIVWMPEILGLWLKEVPEYTILFTRLVILTSMVETIGIPITTAICAGGNIKWFQIVTGTLVLFNLPISYLFLKMGYPPQVTMEISLLLSFVVLFIKIHFAKAAINLDVQYFFIILFKYVIITVLAFIGPLLFNGVFHFNNIIIVLIINIFITVLYVSVIVLFVGMSNEERKMLVLLIRKTKE